MKKGILILGVLAVFISLFTYFSLNPIDKDYNVIVIVVDALRWDHLNYYGYDRSTSPAISSFCDSGIGFDNAISQGVDTRVSIASLFTSRYAIQHRVIHEDADIGIDYYKILPSKEVTLAEVLSEQGYETYGFSSNPVLGDVNFDQGFTSFSIEESDQALTSDVISVLERGSSGKKFIYAHYLAPHAPYNPPQEYLDEFEEGYDLTFDYPPTFAGPGLNLTYDNVSDLTLQYDAEILYVDKEIQNLMRSLDENGYMDNSIVVFTSDHGESLYENEFLGHGYPFNSIMQVPLCLYYPGVESERKSSLMKLIDVAPTILHKLGIKAPSSFEGTFLGRNSPTSFAYTSHDVDGIIAVRGDHDLLQVNFNYSNDDLLDRVMEVRYYDLSNDPYELNNLAGDDFEFYLDKYEDELKYYAQLKEEYDPELNSIDDFDAENNRELLESLGYI